MATPIGFQSGIVAAMNALRAHFPGNKAAWDKLERTLSILADDHDAAIVTPPPPPPPPPPDGYVKVAPRVANKVLPNGSDARYCVVNQPGVFWDPSINRFRDDVATYDQDGLCWGGRSTDLQVPGLTMANDINGREYCSLPTVGDPTKNTGSWAI